MAESAESWVESLSPWPCDGFGLERMRALLAALGNPQLAYPSIHVVGTNGKTTTTSTIEAILLREGLGVGTYTSPHVREWGERIRVAGRAADFERALARVRRCAEELGATQFEVLTAAALLEFADTEVDVAAVEAGLGGRHDATNVLRSPVQVLTNVALEHTQVLGSTREEIACEKLAVVRPGSTVIVGEPEWTAFARSAGARRVVVADGNVGCAAAAAEAFLGRPVEPALEARLPGRLEVITSEPLEIWDGAHNPHGVRYLLERLPLVSGPVVLVASILRDKQVDEMLRLFSAVAQSLVATTSRNERSLAAAELAERARRLGLFRHVEAATPEAARRRGRDLAGARGAVLVAGSLYLLAELAAVRRISVPCVERVTS